MKNERSTIIKCSTKHSRYRWSLFFACMVSLCSFGFASWTIGGSNNVLQFDVSTEELIDTNIFKILSVSSVTLGQDGLIEDETIVGEAPIKISFSVNNESAKNLAVNGYFTFTMNFISSNPDFLAKYIVQPTLSTSSAISSTINNDTMVSEVSYQVPEEASSDLVVTYLVRDVKDSPIGAYLNDLPNFSFGIRSSSK